MSRLNAWLDTNYRPRSWKTLALGTAAWSFLLSFALLAAGCGGDVDSRMQEVRALQDVGQFTESIEELREVLAISPDLPEANYRLGAALVQTGDASRAIWSLKKASESPEYAVPAGLLLASAHFGINDYEEAARAASRVLEIDPDRIAALHIRAKANVGIHHLDEALADAERLIELMPDDYVNRVIYASILFEMGRGEEAEIAHRELKRIAEASDNPAYQRGGCIAPAMFAKDFKKDMEEAEALYLDCAEKYPTDGFIIDQVMNFLDGVDKRDAATELVRKAVKDAPENLSLRSTLANRLQTNGDSEGAEAVLLEAAETFNSAAAWNLLANYYRQSGDSEKALGAIEKVIDLTGGGGDELRFTQADVLVDLGQYDLAEEVVQSLDQPIYATLIRGRIELARGDPAAALASFEKGIRHWPNNPGARYLAGVAARELGDSDRAISELREAMRAGKSQTQAAHLLARIYLDRGDYKEAVNFASESARRSRGPGRPEDYIIAIRALTKLGDYEKARKSIDLLADLPGQQATAAFETAKLEAAQNGTQAAIDSIKKDGLDLTDPANERVLGLLVEYLGALDRDEEALAPVDAALARHPDESQYHVLRGTVLSRSKQFDLAKQEFETARELDPESGAALAGLAFLAGRAGNLEEAVELYDAAARHNELNTADYEYYAAQLTLTLGDKEAAIERLKNVTRKYLGHAGSRNDLAWLLAEEGQDLDLALALAEEARRLDPSPDILDTLGAVHMKRGEAAAAVAVLENAYEQQPDSPYLRLHLGTALALAGDTNRARELLQSALDTEGFAEADAARRELAKLEP